MAIGEAGEQESDMELDLLAESESDSDDNQSNINDTASSGAQRSIQTHATGGSEAAGVANLALFSEDDSDESTQQVSTRTLLILVKKIILYLCVSQYF